MSIAFSIKYLNVDHAIYYTLLHALKHMLAREPSLSCDGAFVRLHQQSVHNSQFDSTEFDLCVTTQFHIIYALIFKSPFLPSLPFIPITDTLHTVAVLRDLVSAGMIYLSTTVYSDPKKEDRHNVN
ncbi:hypothetical protein ACTXT7_005799 [Hymenolepis weldensis]